LARSASGCVDAGEPPADPPLRTPLSLLRPSSEPADAPRRRAGGSPASRGV
jgi:hypothetical protein